VARYGGDEFVVLMPRATASVALAAAQRLRIAVQAPLRLSERRVSLSCSIGVALSPRDADTADELLRSADRAMLQAKAAGRNQVHELTPDGQERLGRRSRLRRDLGEALASGGLSAVYQPLLDLRSGHMAGVELLARWQHAELGLVSPAEFIPVAEESGQVGELGVWALRTATRAAMALRSSAMWQEGEAPRVAFNLSTLQLADPALVPKLVAAVRAEGGQPRWLEVELTESIQLAEDPEWQERLRQLRQAGFHLSLDDFGAGYSSFSYLSRIYFDRLKIDRALVHAASQSPDRRAVTGSIIAMAHGLGLQVVAEGIETAEQHALLQAQGCDLVQGFHICRPMPLAALLAWRP
jgi:EAL domain-containing protein (putative c-di-GMP-specific phosphodiesterase class I)